MSRTSAQMGVGGGGGILECELHNASLEVDNASPVVLCGRVQRTSTENTLDTEEVKVGDSSSLTHGVNVAHKQPLFFSKITFCSIQPSWTFQFNRHQLHLWRSETQCLLTHQALLSACYLYAFKITSYAIKYSGSIHKQKI